ncbi:amidase signature domain-containing protein [Cyathus striatus]|nr:amidase signature domain-containing protein [Cyathus striatus]
MKPTPFMICCLPLTAFAQQDGLDKGFFTSVDLVKAYFARIDEVNLKGPALRAVLETNPSALAQAAVLDKERTEKRKRGLLHGIPVLLKDNIATVASEGMNTTAGSFSLLGSVVPDDAGVVKRLRRAGAIILGKANLSEFAHFRGNLASGWSGRGGQNTAAYFPGLDPCGSSSGSGVAASIGLATVMLGSETDGSITCPTSHNNLVGIKPTVGLTSRAGVVPISSHQDTIGPLTRSMTDAAIVLSVISGKDPEDNFTLVQPQKLPDYTKALNKDALKGKRIGVPRQVFLLNSTVGNDPAVAPAFESALAVLRELGAVVIDPADLPDAKEISASHNETFVLDVDFKYYESLLENPSGVRSLADLIVFNDANPSLEEPVNFTDQSDLVRAQATTGRNATFFQSLAFDHELGGARGIDAALKQFRLDALVLPAAGLTTVPAALTGYPIVTGFYPNNTTTRRAGPLTVYPAPGAPFGLSFLGTAFSEFDLIGFAFAYEQKTMTRLGRKAFDAAIPKTQLANICRAMPSEDHSISALPDLYEASISELQAGMEASHYSSKDLVQAYIWRIKEVNAEGPSLRAVLELNPRALEQAEELDRERQKQGKRGPLHGIPILLKVCKFYLMPWIILPPSQARVTLNEIPAFQKLTTPTGMNTTAGSFSLLGSVVQDDAVVVKRLRRAGAVILGRGGQATSAYYPNADPCGSSSGSAVSVSIGLASVSLGTETDGSIVCPASFNNIVGIKPTVGLTSTTGIIPVSRHQDTVGPFGRSVVDAAAVLTVIANDNFIDENMRRPLNKTFDFAQGLSEYAFKGKRIGVPRRKFWSDDITDGDPSVDQAFSQALSIIRSLGATVIDPADLPSADEIKRSNQEMTVVQTDMKYLSSLCITPPDVQTLADIIHFNDKNIYLEKPSGYEDQSGLISSEATNGINATYNKALKDNYELSAIRGIDAVLKQHRLDALVVPLIGHVTTASVPLGFFPDTVKIRKTGPITVYPAPGVPFGLIFFGTAYSDYDLIGFAYAYERATRTRLARRGYSEAVPTAQIKSPFN